MIWLAWTAVSVVFAAVFGVFRIATSYHWRFFLKQPRRPRPIGSDVVDTGRAIIHVYWCGPVFATATLKNGTR